VNEDIAALQAEFPAYQIWRESVRGRSRYVALRRAQGLGPYTVITPDISELRDALLPGRADANPAGCAPTDAHCPGRRNGPRQT